MLKNIIIGVVIVLSFSLLLKWYNRPENGIHGIGRNAVLIEGECITINWDATESEAERALAKWQELKNK